ncbi:hypothetical protein SJAV_01320 [Sulfurisphaera javensis]|uniref:Homeodomain phBC6A51-type domain-containing protein n=1 Tax=Sulfurisphaera javensis TaxID=2049879 RepID=A0AAT9GN94_9CREN
MSLEMFYTKQLASIISDVDVLNIMTWVNDLSPEKEKEIEKISGISRKTIYNWKTQRVSGLSIESKEKFLNALFQVMGIKEGISLIAKAKRFQYVALLNILISLGKDVSDLQVIVKDGIITNKTE